MLDETVAQAAARIKQWNIEFYQQKIKQLTPSSPLMKDQTPAHPAKFSKGFTEIFRDILNAHLKTPWKYDTPLILDPFAGVGGIHELRPEFATYGVEIEQEWADTSPYTFCADSTSLPERWTGQFQAILTSPTYGNRMADHHKLGPCKTCKGTGGICNMTTQEVENYLQINGELPPFNQCLICLGTGKEASKRNTYTHTLGHDLKPNNTGKVQFTGDAYKTLHKIVYAECLRVLESDGLVIVNISDHIRKGQQVPVVQWHKDTLTGMGLTLHDEQLVNTQRFGFGENREQRVKTESILILRKEP